MNYRYSLGALIVIVRDKNAFDIIKTVRNNTENKTASSKIKYAFSANTENQHHYYCVQNCNVNNIP